MRLKFESLTDPYSARVFLEEIIGRSALHVVGDRGKFSSVASWATLNDLLSFGGLSHPRLRLFKDGAEIPERAYTGAGGSSSSSLLVRELTGALRGGATLAIESVDELREPISDLCGIVEEAVGVPTHADMLASWEEPALPAMRCNEHDVFIFQVEGRREWRLHCPPDHAFMLRDPGDFERDPTWRGVLAKGDALYVPRGWLHRDEPVGEASLCVAAKFRQPTGMDLIGRLAHQLAGTRLRSDIPRFAPAQGLSEYLTLFQRELTEQAGRAGLLAGALAEIQMTAEPRIRFSLPWSAAEAPPPQAEDLRIVPLVRFPHACIRHCPGEGAFEVFVGRSPTRFGHEVMPIVELVLLSGGLTARQLLEIFQKEMPRERILQCIAELIASGTVCLRGRAPECTSASRS